MQVHIIVLCESMSLGSIHYQKSYMQYNNMSIFPFPFRMKTVPLIAQSSFVTFIWRDHLFSTFYHWFSETKYLSNRYSSCKIRVFLDLMKTKEAIK